MTGRWLLDTNVVSELHKGRRCDPRVAEWRDETLADEHFLSVLVVGELRRGIESLRRRDGAAAYALDKWLETLVAGFVDRVLPVDAPVAEAWGHIGAPRPLPIVDGLLAATAQVHGLVLVTRNVADLRRTGVSVLNPFAAR